jgi:rhodanese-related sulfurtransferase
MRIIIASLILASLLNAGKYDKVKITEEISRILVYHKGKVVDVHRVQDTEHKLTGYLANVSNPCPDRCLQPIIAHPNVETVGEVEIIKFMEIQESRKNGLLVDVRSREDYTAETIPSAINIPYTVVDNTRAIEEILKVLGFAKEDKEKAQELIFFCNGSTCSKSANMIRAFVEMGYPTEKIKYYHGGIQMWKMLGFTTVTTK